MNIKVISDLHFEFMLDNGKRFMDAFPNQDVDVLAIAGDTIPLHNRRAKEAFKRICDKFPKVVVVLGNHEFYGGNPIKSIDIMKGIDDSISNIHWLRIDNPFEMDGQRIIGDTLWFKNNPGNVYCSYKMMDFRVISHFEPWVYTQNEQQMAWLNENCTLGDVVITHHIPSHRCVHPRYANNVLNKFFVCEMDDMMINKHPKIWHCGHTHCHFDSMVYDTRVIINPYGYPEEMLNCDKNFVLSLP